MKVENNGNVHILDTLAKATSNAGTQQGSNAKSSTSQSVADKVEISGTREEVARLTEKVKAASTDREERIQAVKEAVQSGTYQVDGKLVAKSMLKDHILNEVL